MSKLNNINHSTKIRAQSIIKIQTPNVNLTSTYVKGTDLMVIVSDMLDYIALDIGPKATRKLVENKLKYIDGFGEPTL